MASGKFGYAIDTLLLAKKAVADRKLNVPNSYKLADLYEYVSGETIDSAHRAMADVKATSTILRYKHFWAEQRLHVFPFCDMVSDVTVPEDSDVDASDVGDGDDVSDSDDSSIPPPSYVMDEETPLPPSLGWQMNSTFDGYNVGKRFEDVFSKRNTRGAIGNSTGLQCSPNLVNSPAKAWRQIFTHSLLDKVVSYTNEYGES